MALTKHYMCFSEGSGSRSGRVELTAGSSITIAGEVCLRSGLDRSGTTLFFMARNEYERIAGGYRSSQVKPHMET